MISMPALTILPTGMESLITLPDILICDEVVGTEKYSTVERRVEKVDKCEGFKAQLVRGV
jgi:hypothetical protein